MKLLGADNLSAEKTKKKRSIGSGVVDYVEKMAESLSDVADDVKEGMDALAETVESELAGEETKKPKRIKVGATIFLR